MGTKINGMVSREGKRRNRPETQHFSIELDLPWGHEDIHGKVMAHVSGDYPGWLLAGYAPAEPGTRGGPRPKVRTDDGRATNGGVPGDHRPGAGRPPKARTVVVNGTPIAGLWLVKVVGDSVLLESVEVAQ